MNKDDIKKLIAKKIGVSSSESELASQILLDSMAENLTGFTNAVKVKGLGIFQVTDDKRELIYSPAGEDIAGKTDSFYMRFDVPNPPSEGDDFDEDIFSLSVGKPTVPLNKGAEDGGTSFLVIRKQIEERVRDILSESEYYENYDLLESLGISAVPEEKPEIETAEDDEIENIFNIKEDESEEVETSGGDKSEGEDVFNLMNEVDEKDKFPLPGDEPVVEDKNIFEDFGKAEDTEDEPEDTAQNNMKSFFERLNEIESKDSDKYEAAEEEPEETPAEEPPAARKPIEEKQDNGHFMDPIDFYSYPERDEDEQKKAKEAAEDEDPDLATLKNFMLDDDEEEPDPVFEEPRVITNDEDEYNEPVFEKPKKKEEDDDIFGLDDMEKRSDGEDSSAEWNWGDDLDDGEKTSKDKDSEEEDPFDTLERTLMEDDMDDLNLEEVAPTRVTGNDEESEEEEEQLAAGFAGEDDYEDINDVSGSNMRQTAERKIKSYRENASVGSLIVIAAFVIIIGTILYFMFFSGGSTVKESSSVPDQEEILENTSDVSSVPESEEPAGTGEEVEQETPSEGVTDEAADNTVPEEAIPTPVNNAETKPAATGGTAGSSSNSNLYREYPNEVRISNLIARNGDTYSVQVSSWKNPIKAENEVKRLRAAGYDAFIINAYLPAKGGTWHRVRIGGFKSVEEARKFSNEYQN